MRESFEAKREMPSSASLAYETDPRGRQRRKEPGGSSEEAANPGETSLGDRSSLGIELARVTSRLLQNLARDKDCAPECP
jgi:hypothetical protein